MSFAAGASGPRGHHSWSAPTSVHASPDVSPSRVRASLQTQIEFYFSQQNLASDTYLRSQMNDARFVPVSVIADFKLVKKITTDVDMIVDCMRRSKLLEVDSTGTLVRPSSKASERTTIILRDIPADTPVDEIRALFDNEACGTVTSLRADIGDTWFVTFEDEVDCLRTALHIRQQTFKGKLVRLRVKSENLRSFYQEAPQQQVPVGQQFFHPQQLQHMFPAHPGAPFQQQGPRSGQTVNGRFMRRSSSFAVPYGWEPEMGGAGAFAGVAPNQGPFVGAGNTPGQMPRRYASERGSGPQGEQSNRRKQSARKQPREPSSASAAAAGSSSSGYNGSAGTVNGAGAPTQQLQPRARKSRGPSRSATGSFPSSGPGGKRTDENSSPSGAPSSGPPSASSSPRSHQQQQKGAATAVAAVGAPQPELGPEHFPALPSASTTPKRSAPASPVSGTYVSRTLQQPAPIPMAAPTAPSTAPHAAGNGGAEIASHVSSSSPPLRSVAASVDPMVDPFMNLFITPATSPAAELVTVAPASTTAAASVAVHSPAKTPLSCAGGPAASLPLPRLLNLGTPSAEGADQPESAAKVTSSSTEAPTLELLSKSSQSASKTISYASMARRAAATSAATNGAVDKAVAVKPSSE